MNWRRVLDAVRTGGLSLREERPRCPQCDGELTRGGYCHQCVASEELVQRAARPLTSAVLEVRPQSRGHTAAEIVDEIVQRCN